MSTPYLRFKSGMAGVDRQYELKNLRMLGVVSLKPAFPHDLHPERAAVYIVGVTETVDHALLDRYIADSVGTIGLSLAQLEELRSAPMPDRTQARGKQMARPEPQEA